jgi:hypothetical protein
MKVQHILSNNGHAGRVSVKPLANAERPPSEPAEGPRQAEPTTRTKPEKPAETKVIHIKGSSVSYFERTCNSIKPLSLEASRKYSGRCMVMVSAGTVDQLGDVDWHVELHTPGFETLVLKDKSLFTSKGDCIISG